MNASASTTAPLEDDKLTALLSQLKRVGLTRIESFKEFLRADDSFFEDVAEWPEYRGRVGFIIKKSSYTGLITHVYVNEYVSGASEYSKELIAEVNSELANIFSELFLTEEQAAMLEPVDILFVNYGSQIASVRRSDGSTLGVNLWEIHGRTRRADGFSNPRFRDAGRI